MLTCSPTSRMSEPSATTSSSPTTPSGPTTALAGCRHSPSYQGLTCPRSLVLICPPDGGAYPRCAGTGLYDHETDGDWVHHSDRGVQHLSIRYTERLSEAGTEPSVGSRGDSYDNALAEPGSA